MQQPYDRTRSLRLLAVVSASLLFATALGGCSARMTKEGNLIEPPLLAQIQPGTTNRDQVQNLIGSPSSVAAFDQNTWYYISKRTQRWAFLDPMVMDEQVVQIDFDENGVVTNIRKYGEKDTHDVEMVARTTPSRGKALTVVDEVYNTLLNQFGNGGGLMNSRDPFAR